MEPIWIIAIILTYFFIFVEGLILMVDHEIGIKRPIIWYHTVLNFIVFWTMFVIFAILLKN